MAFMPGRVGHNERRSINGTLQKRAIAFAALDCRSANAQLSELWGEDDDHVAHRGKKKPLPQKEERLAKNGEW